jgi:hypothetical protein
MFKDTTTLNKIRDGAEKEAKNELPKRSTQYTKVGGLKQSVKEVKKQVLKNIDIG